MDQIYQIILIAIITPMKEVLAISLIILKQNRS